MEHTKISTDIEQNIKQFQQLFADSADIKMKEMRLGKGKRRRCFLAYIEVAVSNMLLETTALGRLLAALSELPDADQFKRCCKTSGDFRHISGADYFRIEPRRLCAQCAWSTGGISVA